MPGAVSKPVLFSYAAIFLLLVLAGWLRLTTPLLTVLFSYFALSQLTFWRSRWVAIVIFVLLVAAIFWGFAFLLRESFEVLPAVVVTSIPRIVQFATAHGVELPFTDVASLKDVALESVRGTLGYVGNFAKLATKEFVFLVVGVVIAITVFVSSRRPAPLPDLGAEANLYTLSAALLGERCRAFYGSFERVMGAQILISAINTVLTAFFVYGCSLRYATVVIALTFLCGLLPIIGNIMSNTLIVSIAFTESPQMAAWALLFLVSIHKLEYFLNSRIVGSRIRHPMWLILVALILGERLMGIPGLILAPVVLHFIKAEASRYRITINSLPDGTVTKGDGAARLATVPQEMPS